MSLEMLVILKRNRVPSRDSWQGAIDALALPFQFHPKFDPLNDRGFSPSMVKGISSGFEIWTRTVQDVRQNYPSLKDLIEDDNWCFSFIWGGSMSEGACVLAGTAGLVKLCEAVAYSPEDRVRYDLDGLLRELSECLKRM